MTIAEQIREDMKSAMKAKKPEVVTTMRSLMAGFMNEMVATGGTPQTPVSDEVATAVIKRAVKQRKDALSQYNEAGRSDLAAVEQAELEILEEYLPATMSTEAITEIAITKKSELDIQDKAKMGILVGAVMKETAGNADGQDVKKVVESLFD